MSKKTNRFKTNLGKALAQLANNTNVIGNFLAVDPSVGANNKFQSFKKTGVRRHEALANNAVSTSFERPADYSLAQLGKYNPYGSIFYSSVNDNKAGRLYEYRLMAGYSEVTNALESICNKFITVDKNGDVAKLKYIKPNTPVEQESVLVEEFNYFIRLFNFKDKGYHYCWRYLVEGELFLELIVNNDTLDNLQKGILGIMDIPADLVDPIWRSKAQFIIDSFIGRKPIYDLNDPSKIERIELIPYQANQLFYVYSGDLDPNGENMRPYIERARRRYIQLSYIEDAIVIYRLVRAPERLVFTVPTGNMTAYDAERYMKTLMDQYWKTKVMDVNTGDITQKYNPQQMMDAYYFSKPTNGEAIKVDQLKGADNLGELKDLDFFLRALYRDLRVPSTFLNPEKNANTDPSTILQEELDFAKFIVRIQQTFARSLKQAFITHLKFTGLWQQYKLHENYLEIEFVKPDNYYLMRDLQTAELQAQLYNTIAGNEAFSKIYAMKQYMGWSDKEILANIAFRKAEAIIEWEIQQRREYGPSWKTILSGGDNQQGNENPLGDGGMEGFGGLDGGLDDGLPPDFGGGQAATDELGAEPNVEPANDNPSASQVEVI